MSASRFLFPFRRFSTTSLVSSFSASFSHRPPSYDDKFNYKAFHGLLQRASNKELSSDSPELFSALSSLKNQSSDLPLNVRGTIAALKLLERIPGEYGEKIIDFLENHLLWNSRSASLKDLTFILTYAGSALQVQTEKMSPSFNSRLKLFSAVSESLEKRWIEMEEPSVIVTLLHYRAYFSSRLMNRIEDRFFEVIEESFEGPDLIRALKALSTTHQRSLPLIKPIVFHLKKKLGKCNLDDVSHAFYSLSILNYANKELLNLLSKHILGEIMECKDPEAIIRIVNGIGKLRFKHPILLNLLSEWMTRNLELLSKADLCAFCMTAAVLDFHPPENLGEVLFKHILSVMVSREESMSQTRWLDFVWSLSLLSQGSTTHFQSLLNDEFVESVTYGSSNSAIFLKLLNVNSIATRLTPSYTGFPLSPKTIETLKERQPSLKADKKQFANECLEILSAMSESPLDSNLNVNTGMGFFINVEMILSNETLKPLDASIYSGFIQNPIDVPESAQRIAILFLSYVDCCLDGSPAGLFSLYKRLLESIHYKVLLMTYGEYSKSATLNDKVHLTQEKLRKLMNS